METHDLLTSQNGSGTDGVLTARPGFSGSSYDGAQEQEFEQSASRAAEAGPPPMLRPGQSGSFSNS
jgi:hypothetical protein